MKFLNVFTSSNKEKQDNQNEYVTSDKSHIKHKQVFTVNFICDVWSVTKDEFFKVEQIFFDQYSGNCKVFEGQCRRYEREKRLYTRKLCKRMHRFWYSNKENLLPSKRFGRCEYCGLSFLERPSWNQKYCAREWCGIPDLLHCWYDYECARCEENLVLRIHHVDENPSDSDYRNHKKDFIEDCKRFVVLCPTCHEGYHSGHISRKEIEKYHKKLSTSKKERLRQLSRYAQKKFGKNEPDLQWQQKLDIFLFSGYNGNDTTKSGDMDE